MTSSTKEPQYNHLLEVEGAYGRTQLGLMMNQAWHDDPKRFAFTFSRYKFVGKMLSGKKNVLEIGCGDGFPARIVKQEVDRLVALDFDEIFIKDALSQPNDKWPIEYQCHDILAAPAPFTEFCAAYSLDVLEHIDSAHEDVYMRNIAYALREHGMLIIGTPSLESQAYASALSKEGHINCKTMGQLRALVEKYFHNCLCFSMNDEVVHTGFSPMSHYNFAIGIGKK